MKFSRRLAFLAPLGALLPGCLTVVKTAPPSYHSEWGLGKYLSHYITSNHQHDWLDMDDGKDIVVHRYLNFPIEATLTIEFENGTEIYTGYNAKKEVVQLINTISYQKLLEYQIKDGLSDNYSTRFDFSKDNYKLKLMLTSVTWHGKKKSSTT